MIRRILWVFWYSFLAAFILPSPSELVLLERNLSLGAILVVSGLGKTFGSILALGIGHSVFYYFFPSHLKNLFFKLFGKKPDFLKELERRHLEIKEKTVLYVKKYGLIGLGLTLSIPLVPDTVSIYAYSALKKKLDKMVFLGFLLAVFIGSVNRLLITYALFTLGIRIVP